MSSEPQLQLQTHAQIDKRVPPEIWERILSRLYPSQLSRMSRVNRNFNKIVSSLPGWSRMFSVVFGPKMRLRTLRNMPESKSYMLYVCAGSLYICEECLKLVPYLLVQNHSQNLPSSTLVPPPTMSKGNIKYLGEEVNLNWTVRMCRSCRDKLDYTIEVGEDIKTKDRIQWYRTQP